MTDSGDACRSDSLPCHVQDASLQLMLKCVTFFNNVSPCTSYFQAFLTEIELLVQLHFKAFLVKLRKARVQYLRSVPDDLFRFAVGASVHIVGQTLRFSPLTDSALNLVILMLESVMPRSSRMLSMSISRPSFVNEQVNYWESASLSPHPSAVVSGG